LALWDDYADVHGGKESFAAGVAAVWQHLEAVTAFLADEKARKADNESGS
jgi:hypothetical protein